MFYITADLLMNPQASLKFLWFLSDAANSVKTKVLH